jgi:HD-like signal output (HDOD) protein
MKFLQLQTSTFFGSSRDMTDLTSAISFLRFDRVRELMETPGFYRTDDDLSPATVPVVRAARERCVRAANKAADRVQNRGGQAREVDEAWIAGLLSGMGALAVAELAPEKYGDGDLQRHAAISVYLAHLWGLPSLCCTQLEAFADRLTSNFVGSFAV